MDKIVLKEISKSYRKGQVVVDKINLEIKEQEFIVLVGPSGCGKSTTLRMIAGLEDITSGTLMINGKVMNQIAAKYRNIAMVFQNYALYPHMTVRENLAFGLENIKTEKKIIDQKVKMISDMLGLGEYLERKPSALSGGQRQRVALGRAMIKDSDIYLMDEPLSNLDAQLRVQMRAEIIDMHRKMKATTVYVTHDQTEAMTMADKIVVMKDGVIQQYGTPREVYNEPANIFVASFIGSPKINLLPFIMNHRELILGVRPEDVEISRFRKEEEDQIPAKVHYTELIGAEMLVYLDIRDPAYTWSMKNAENRNLLFIVRVPSDLDIKEGELVYLKLKKSKIHYFDKETGKRVEN